MVKNIPKKDLGVEPKATHLNLKDKLEVGDGVGCGPCLIRLMFDGFFTSPAIVVMCKNIRMAHNMAHLFTFFVRTEDEHTSIIWLFDWLHGHLSTKVGV